jgi:hypothetical protein
VLLEVGENNVLRIVCPQNDGVARRKKGIHRSRHVVFYAIHDQNDFPITWSNKLLSESIEILIGSSRRAK